MRAKYIGNGEYHGGIPARDLETEDWAELDAEQRKLVRKSSLYEMVKSDEQPEAEVTEKEN